MIPLQPFSTIKPNDPETLRKLNALVEAVNQLNVMTGDDIIKVLRTPAGIVFRAEVAAIQEKIPQTVAGLGSSVRKAFINGAVSGTAVQSCYLDVNSGTPVNVTATICGGTALDEALPLLADDKIAYVVYDSVDSKWRFLFPFDTTEECVCEAPA